MYSTCLPTVCHYVHLTSKNKRQLTYFATYYLVFSVSQYRITMGY